MKIALVSPYDFPYPGGVTEHTVALASGLQQAGHEVQILAACSGYQGRTVANTRVMTRRITSLPIGGTVARVGLSPLSFFRIRQVLKQENFDVIHLQEPLTPSLTWWVLLQSHLSPHSVLIGTFHAYHEQPNWLYGQGRPIFKKLFTRLDALIAVSEAACQFARRMFPDHYHLIPNGIDLARFGPRCGVTSAVVRPPNRPLTLLFVGRLDWRKGFHHLLQSFIKLKPDYSQLRLVVVGPFAARACRTYQLQAQNQGITDIDFVGYVSPERLPEFYHQADIFCAPAVGYESFGIILLEAMAAGLPIVASDIAGYRSVISHGQEGLLVPPHRPDRIEHALRQLLDNPQDRYKMGQAGRRKAAAYSWDDIVAQTLVLYQETIDQKCLGSRSSPPFSRPKAKV